MNYEKIWDDCVKLLDSTEKKSCDLGNGETLTYREYNVGAEHDMVVIPGAGVDDSISAYMAIRDDMKDHRLLCVNPRGYGGSTNNDPNFTHEENAEDIKLFLDKLGITSDCMAMGFSTGGCAACVLAIRYPKLIKASFLLNAVPLDGMRWACRFGKEPTTRDEVKSMCVDRFIEMGIFGGTLEQFHASFQNMCTPKEAFPPINHPFVTKYLYPSNKMYTDAAWPSQSANTFFNVCPIQTPTTPPSTALLDLGKKIEGDDNTDIAKIIVLHGKEDVSVPTLHVKSVTNLAIAELWAPAGTISYYEHPRGHAGFLEDPEIVLKVYRHALSEQVLNNNKKQK